MDDVPYRHTSAGSGGRYDGRNQPQRKPTRIASEGVEALPLQTKCAEMPRLRPKQVILAIPGSEQRRDKEDGIEVARRRRYG